MANSERRRQKRLEKHKAKRREARQARELTPIARLSEAQVRELAGNPIHQCYVSERLFDEGIGHAIISRVAGGRLAVATVLLDVHCLGIKNADVKIAGAFAYEDQLRAWNRSSRLRRVEPAYLKHLVNETEAWARALGFEPHPDYRLARPLLEDIDASACHEQFVFGKDGKPLYFQGPHDSPVKVRHILATLQRTCGAGKFDYFLVASDSDDLEDIQGMLG
jgi:hypothetical protein